MKLSVTDKTSSLQLLTSKDGCVLLDIQRDRLLKLNHVAAEMWTLLSSGCAEPEIVRQLSEKYRVGEDRVATDLSALMRRISELGATGARLYTPKDVKIAGLQSRESYPWYGATLDSFPAPRQLIVLAALLGLGVFDLVLSLFSLRALCWCVSSWPNRKSRNTNPELVGTLCNAVHRACVWYPAKTLCLQRSAVTTCLLRSYGLPAMMKIGVRPMPFVAHAWVELDNSVVNDWPRVKQLYQPLLSN